MSGNLFPGSNGNLFPGSNGNLFPGQKPSSPGMTAGASVPGMNAGPPGPKVSTPMGPNYSRSFFQPQVGREYKSWRNQGELVDSIKLFSQSPFVILNVILKKKINIYMFLTGTIFGRC